MVAPGLCFTIPDVERNVVDDQTNHLCVAIFIRTNDPIFAISWPYTRLLDAALI